MRRPRRSRRPIVDQRNPHRRKKKSRSVFTALEPTSLSQRMRKWTTSVPTRCSRLAGSCPGGTWARSSRTTRRSSTRTRSQDRTKSPTCTGNPSRQRHTRDAPTRTDARGEHRAAALPPPNTINSYLLAFPCRIAFAHTGAAATVGLVTIVWTAVGLADTRSQRVAAVVRCAALAVVAQQSLIGQSALALIVRSARVDRARVAVLRRTRRCQRTANECINAQRTCSHCASLSHAHVYWPRHSPYTEHLSFDVQSSPSSHGLLSALTSVCGHRPVSPSHTASLKHGESAGARLHTVPAGALASTHTALVPSHTSATSQANASPCAEVRE